MIFNFSKNDFETIKNLFLSKNYQKIISEYSLDKQINDANIIRNLLVVKSYFHLGNIVKAQELLLNIDEIFDFHEVKFLIGNYYRNKNQPKKALEYFQSAIKLNEQSPDYFNEAGNVSGDIGSYDLAIEYYLKALNFDLPASIKCILLSNIGNAYYNGGNPEQGIVFSKKSLNLNQNFEPAWTNLGLCLFTLKKYEESINTFKKVLEISPNFEKAINNLAVVYVEIGNFTLAKQYLLKLLEINPNNNVAFLNLGKCQSSLREYHQALASFKKSFEINKNNLTAVSNYLMNLNYLDKISHEEIINEHILKSKYFTQYNQKIDPFQKFNNSKIKIGYVSADFNNHSVKSFFQPIITGHNKDKFEVFCFYNDTKIDEFTQIVKANSNFIEISKKNDDEVVSFIKEQNIDILIDLSGHTKGSRLSLFAKKPCPIQITWIGYATTTGLEQMDYRIVDSFTDPPGREINNFPEKLIRMKNFFMTYQGIEEYDVLTAPSFKNNFITFGSFNNSTKINNFTIQIWSKILKNDHQNKLVLKSFQFIDMNIRNKIKSEFMELGVNEDQLIFYDKMPRNEHFSLYNQIDIALDPTPYNGTTTTIESLWMGVPVITLEGSIHQSRVTHSILMNMNLNELTAKNIEEYVEIALKLASDKNKIQNYKETLRAKLLSSPIMNHKNFLMELEQHFKNLIKK